MLRNKPTQVSPFVKTTLTQQYMIDISLRKILNEYSKSKINRKLLKNLVNPDDPKNENILILLKHLKTYSNSEHKDSCSAIDSVLGKYE